MNSLKFLLAALNTKYIHSNPGIYSLYSYSVKRQPSLAEYIGIAENKFLEDYKRNKETKHPYAAKTDCLLVRGDFNTFFSDSSVTEYYWSSSGNGF